MWCFLRAPQHPTSVFHLTLLYRGYRSPLPPPPSPTRAPPPGAASSMPHPVCWVMGRPQHPGALGTGLSCTLARGRGGADAEGRLRPGGLIPGLGHQTKGRDRKAIKRVLLHFREEETESERGWWQGSSPSRDVAEQPRVSSLLSPLPAQASRGLGTGLPQQHPRGAPGPPLPSP